MDTQIWAIQDNRRVLGRGTYMDITGYPWKTKGDIFSVNVFSKPSSRKRTDKTTGKEEEEEVTKECLYCDTRCDSDLAKVVREFEDTAKQFFADHKADLLPKRTSTDYTFSSCMSMDEDNNMCSLRLAVPTNKDSLGCQNEKGEVISFEDLAQHLTRKSDFTAEVAVNMESFWIAMGKYGVRPYARGIKLRKKSEEEKELSTMGGPPKREAVLF